MLAPKVSLHFNMLDNIRSHTETNIKNFKQRNLKIFIGILFFFEN